VMMQAASGCEADRWVSAVHRACTASHVRHHGRADTLQLLNAHVRLLDSAIQQVCHATSSRHLTLGHQQHRTADVYIIRPHRRPTYVDAAYCYRRSSVVHRSVGLSVTIVRPAKTAEPIEMPGCGFG